MDTPKIVIVIPGYNIASVLPKTIAELPKGCADEIILVDDGSTDGTAQVGTQLGLKVVVHPNNRGYGGAQKTGYQEAIRLNAQIAIMVHGDNQYDPSIVTQFSKMLLEDHYDMVTGTRMVLGDALKRGMPVWKFVPNRFLTWLENKVFQTSVSDYHNGYRAYSVAFLRRVPLDLLSEKYDFDTDMMIQAALRHCRIGEIPHQTRYEDENSKMSFMKGVVYGLSILRTVSLYSLHRWKLCRQRVFEIEEHGTKESGDHGG